ncbi:hypothetical protein O0L34_g12157 [Tuta absoluta]|nr:hypothetical protein O0L34_g12157 [Tuta absoluta]
MNSAAKIYSQVSQERYEIIQERYSKYMEALNDVTKDPVKVFDPLGKKQMDELTMIREISKELQFKKDEDMKRAAAAASQAEEDAKKAAEEEKAKEAEKAEGEKAEDVEKKE